ncbi:MAG: protein adenylyltransferase SelO, partial [Shimia sp.]
RIRAWNAPLAAELGLEPDVATYGGTTIPEGLRPLAQMYAGHQFGNWVPQLGDGRAVLLGEAGGMDVQLKGSGRTPFSRGGDGRAWLGPVLREYLISEAMHALGIPTTRALAIVTTGETVLREAPLPGAILTRVARSHLRVGTFQAQAARGDEEALRALTDYAIARHYPGTDAVEAFLLQVVEAQARLVARWMAVGFVHGVMNTDNCHIGGLTIDYGPCAFMDGYHPGRVFSSIDHGGRYAYAAQPNLAAWNLAQMATALLPLMPDREVAIRCFTGIVNSFAESYTTAWRTAFGAKLGLAETEEDDVALIQGLLSLMAEGEADFTTTFRALAENGGQERLDALHATEGFAAWHRRWQARQPDATLMAATNPALVPRNHRVEEAIRAAVQDDWTPFEALHTALSTPFETPAEAHLTLPPAAGEAILRTTCGT